MEIFKKSADYIKNHKKGIGLVILSGVVLAATAVLKNKNKSKYDLRSYGINKK